MIVFLIAALLSVFAVGTWAWRAPGIGLIGSLGGHAPGWLVVLGTIVGAFGVSDLADDPSVTSIVAVVLCAFTIASGAYFAHDQWSALRALGIHTGVGDYFAVFRRVGPGPDDTVTYGPVDGQSPRIAIYRPAPADEPSPVVLFIHGGGWADGNETSDTVLNRSLANRGFLVFSATYTLATDSRPTWDVAPKELACALATAQRLAPQYGGSTERFYVAGASAGGHLATLVANRISAGDDLDCGCGALPVIHGVAGIIPAVDPRYGDANRYWGAGKAARRMISTFAGGLPADVPDRYDAVSATKALHPDAPPTLLVYGPNDWLVQRESVEEYADRARREGVQIRAVPIPWTGHLMGLSGAARKAIVELTVAWFDDHRP